MRIIGGKYRSRVLTEFEGMDVRPTGDRVREALFNILSLKIYGESARFILRQRRAGAGMSLPRGVGSDV